MLIPGVLKKESEWKSWRREAEDYLEESALGMKVELELVRKMAEPVESSSVNDGWWELRASLYRFLRTYTTDALKRLVETVPDDNGWEAWRRLHLQCEPMTGAEVGTVMSDFTMQDVIA